MESRRCYKRFGLIFIPLLMNAVSLLPVRTWPSSLAKPHDTMPSLRHEIQMMINVGVIQHVEQYELTLWTLGKPRRLLHFTLHAATHWVKQGKEGSVARFPIGQKVYVTPCTTKVDYATAIAVTDSFASAARLLQQHTHVVEATVVDEHSIESKVTLRTRRGTKELPLYYGLATPVLMGDYGLGERIERGGASPGDHVRARLIGRSPDEQILDLVIDPTAWRQKLESVGTTPLMLAAGEGNNALVRRLLARGAKINDRNMSGATALVEAARSRSGDPVGTMRLLLRHGADTSSKNAALFEAASVGNREVIKLLLAYGANVNAHSVEGWTPLSAADDEGRLEIVNFLLSRGARPNIRGASGQAALLFLTGSKNAAAYKERPAIVRALIAYGADVNVRDNNGKTPLMNAVAEIDVPTVQILLHHGAQVNMKDNTGKTALQMAKQAGNWSLYSPVIELLKQAGAKE